MAGELEHEEDQEDKVFSCEEEHHPELKLIVALAATAEDKALDQLGCRHAQAVAGKEQVLPVDVPTTDRRVDKTSASVD